VDEVAFYDALEVNDSAVKVLGEPTLKTIARELVDTVRRNATIDWTVRENIRANLRTFGAAAPRVRQRISSLGKTVGSPWTQDEKTSALAALIASDSGASPTPPQ